jgi:hypothetical protein
VRHGESACYLLNFRLVPWGVRLVAYGWYLYMSLVSSWMQLVVGECSVCWV